VPRVVRNARDAPLGGGEPMGEAMGEATAGRRETKDRILEAAFPHVAFDGWARRTLVAAATEAGVEPAAATRLFPRGGDSLVLWIDDWADRRMLAALPAERLAAMRVRDRITSLVRAGLEGLEPHREALRRAAVARSLPQNAPDALAHLWRTADRIWTAAGFPMAGERGAGRYSRRATLAGVLIATRIVWLEDRSVGSGDSWAFLDRRIEDVMRLGRWTA